MPTATFKISNLQQYMRLARLAAGYTQVAASLRIPVSDRSLKRYEAGEIVPGEDIIEGMARTYRTPDLLDYYYEIGGRMAA
jgi:transcriptional regulator with XRE-family HTH domain